MERSNLPRDHVTYHPNSHDSPALRNPDPLNQSPSDDRGHGKTSIRSWQTFRIFPRTRYSKVGVIVNHRLGWPVHGTMFARCWRNKPPWSSWWRNEEPDPWRENVPCENCLMRIRTVRKRQVTTNSVARLFPELRGVHPRRGSAFQPPLPVNW